MNLPVVPLHGHNLAVLFCSDCAFCDRKLNLLGLPVVACGHPLARDPVTYDVTTRARTMRRVGRACGPMGRLWQPMVPEDEERPGDLDHIHRLAEEIAEARR